MVQRLKVPDPLARGHVERNDRFGIEVVARARSAVIVARRLLGREVDQPELVVGAEQGPDTAVA